MVDKNLLKILNQGGLVIYPTETTYALGCLLTDKSAIARLYKIKGRPSNQPTSAVFKDLKQIKLFCYLTNQEQRIAEFFWPGPLTLCLKTKENVPKDIVASDQTLGVRIPNFPWLKELLTQLDTPLLSPSANFRGQIAPRKLDEIDRSLSKLVDYVVDIEPGGKKPSTIVKVEPNKIRLIREGDIPIKAIEDKLKGVNK